MHGDILDNCHGKTTSQPALASYLDRKSSVYGSDYLSEIRLARVRRVASALEANLAEHEAKNV